MITVLAVVLTAAAVVAAERATAGESPVVRMVVLIGVLFLGMKVAVAAEWTRRTGTRLGFGRWLAFGLWVGMRPADFATRRDPPRPLAAAPGGRALFIGLGLWMLAGVLHDEWRTIALVLALPALSLILHFGVLRLAAVFWRARGFDVAPAFDAPLRASSLGEFWSRRWNRAFSDMTALVVYQPVARTYGPGAALMAAFSFSGILHELAISVPVGAGYGGPLAYFLLHGGLVALERRPRGPRGRVWTTAAVLLPLPLLFHPPFLDGVVARLLL